MRPLQCLTHTIYHEMIGDIQVVLGAKMKVALRRCKDPRMVKDLSNSNPLASRWDEQTVYQILALVRRLVHGFLLNRRQASVDLNHQPPSTFLRRRPFVARTQKRKSADGHPVQYDSSVSHIIVTCKFKQQEKLLHTYTRSRNNNARNTE